MKTPRERSCTVSCWAATERECRCICAGAMHGKAGESRRQLMLSTAGRIPRTLGEWKLAISKLKSAYIHEQNGDQRVLASVTLRRLGA
jgi:hypothetical protein